MSSSPSFGRSMGVFWLFTALRFGLFGVLFLILWLVGVTGFLAAIIALALSVPLSWVLLVKPRAALAANIEQRVNSRVHARAELDAQLDPELNALSDEDGDAIVQPKNTTDAD